MLPTALTVFGSWLDADFGCLGASLAADDERVALRSLETS